MHIRLTPDDIGVLQALARAVEADQFREYAVRGWRAARWLRNDDFMVFDWQRLVNAGLLERDHDIFGVARYRLTNLGMDALTAVESQGALSDKTAELEQRIAKLEAENSLLAAANRQYARERDDLRQDVGRLKAALAPFVPTDTEIGKAMLTSGDDPGTEVHISIGDYLAEVHVATITLADFRRAAEFFIYRPAKSEVAQS